MINGDAPGALPYEKFLAKESTEPLRIDISPDTLVSLNYSSGTTGNPKGAIRTHRNRLASLGNIVTDILGVPQMRMTSGTCWPCHPHQRSLRASLFYFRGKTSHSREI